MSRVEGKERRGVGKKVRRRKEGILRREKRGERKGRKRGGGRKEY